MATTRFRMLVIVAPLALALCVLALLSIGWTSSPSPSNTTHSPDPSGFNLDKPPEAAQAAAEDPIREDVAGDTTTAETDEYKTGDGEETKGSESGLLAKVMWDFGEYASTVERVLANSFLNPNRLDLTPADREALRAMLRDYGKTIGELEFKRSDQKNRLAGELFDRGVLAAPARDAMGKIPGPKPEHEEQEVGLIVRDGDTRVLRIEWGHDAEYDRARIALFEAKQATVEAIKAFIEAHGVPKGS